MARRGVRESIGEWLALPLSLLLLIFMIYTDGQRLHASALWGTSDWLLAALAGLVVALAGLVMAILSVHRRRARGGRGSGQRFPVLGVAYTVGMLVVFVLTHRRHGQPSADTPIIVAALAAQVVLAVTVALIVALMAFRWMR